MTLSSSFLSPQDNAHLSTEQATGEDGKLWLFSLQVSACPLTHGHYFKPDIREITTNRSADGLLRLLRVVQFILGASKLLCILLPVRVSVCWFVCTTSCSLGVFDIYLLSTIRMLVCTLHLKIPRKDVKKIHHLYN